MINDGLTFNDFVPAAPPAEDDAIARAGEPLAPGATVAGEAVVVAAIQTVYDPEIPVNIYDLGLIYGLRIGAGGAVEIDMTLTAPACPVAGIMPQMVADAVAAADGVGEVEVNMVWDPPWSPERMSDEAKLALDMF